MPAALSLAEAVRILSEYETELSTILTLGGKRPLSATDKSECRERLRRLKARFKEDIATYEELERTRRGGVHIHTLVGTLQEAAARIHVKWNADPQSDNWGVDLYSAKVDVSFYRGQLEERGSVEAG